MKRSDATRRRFRSYGPVRMKELKWTYVTKQLFIYLFLIVFISTFATFIPEPLKAETPKYGGVLKIITRTTPKILGYPPRITGGSYSAAYSCLESLVALDKEGHIKPVLATGWEIGPGQKSITFTLRKGVKFHDGTDFNAEAVKWNIEKQKQAAGKAAFKYVTSMDIIDEHTIRLNLAQYSSTIFGYLSLARGMIASPTAIEKNGVKWANFHPVGTGPFKFGAYKPKVSLKYERFDDYWGGKPYLDGLEFLYIRDSMTVTAAFQKGEAHIIHGVYTPKSAADLKKKGFKVEHAPHLIQFLAGDSGNPDSIFADKRIHMAIEYAIDRKPIANAMGHGFYQALHQPCYPGNMGYLPDLKGREYNPEKAKKLLAEAGYPNGFKTRLIATTTTNRHALVAIQDDLKAVGIDVKLEIVDRGKFSEYQFKGWKNGLAILQAPLGPNHLRFMSNYLSPSSTRFPVVHGSKAWDSLLDQAVAATDFETQKTLTKKLVKMTYDEAFMVPLWVVDLTVVMQQSVKDDNNAKLGYVVHWTPATTWLSE